VLSCCEQGSKVSACIRREEYFDLLGIHQLLKEQFAPWIQLHGLIGNYRKETTYISTTSSYYGYRNMMQYDTQLRALGNTIPQANYSL
jgi:uncharacterized membrane protein YgaE (UPF0421/DUF939 family)